MVDFYKPTQTIEEAELNPAPPPQNDAVTQLDDGGVEIDLGTEEEIIEQEFAAADHYANLAEFIDEDALDDLAHSLCDLVEDDDRSRQEWLDIMTKGIEELGLKIDDTDVPFDGACTATHPLLIEAVTKFQAKAYAELFPARGPVKAKILGIENEQTRRQALRVSTFMNWQVQEQMPEYGPELDRGLFYIALTGSGFKKTYYDRIMNRSVSRFVQANDFIMPYHASDLATCERYTHRYEITSNEVLKHVVAGLWVDNDLGLPADPDVNRVDEAIDEVEGRSKTRFEDEIYTLYEIHTIVDLPGFEDPDGIARPYIITVERDSRKILSIHRNWAEGDPKQEKLLYFTHYIFIPGLGSYGYGYLHLIGSLAKTATATLRQLSDAGTFSNLPAGFKAHGLRVSGDQGPLAPGEFRDVQAPAMDISKALIPLPFKEPSATLFNLLQFIVTSAEKFADSTEQLLSEAKNYGPVGTTMALLEQGGKLYSAIHKRLHSAQAQDFKILARLNSEYLPPQYPFPVAGMQEAILNSDFDGRIDVVPVSDPNMPTQAHRISRAQAIFAIAAQSPQLHDMRKVLRTQYEALGEENPEAFLTPPPAQAVPLDPITENMNIMTMKPVRAGLDQNHSAHIKAHMAFMQMPNVSKNPLALQSGMAHIYEHVSMEYRLRIERILGQQLPPPGQPIPPQLEEQIALAAVEATESMLEEDLMKEVLTDPAAIVAMQGLEVETQKNLMKGKIDAAKLELDREEMLRKDHNADLDRWVDVQKMNKELTWEQNKSALEAQEAEKDRKVQRNGNNER